MSEREQSATVQLKIRMKEPLRAELEQAAQERGVSLNAEAVDRLERSFRKDEDLYGSAITAVFVKMMAVLIQCVENEKGGKLYDDRETTEEVFAALLAHLGAFNNKQFYIIKKAVQEGKRNIGIQNAITVSMFGGLTREQALEKIFGYVGANKEEPDG